MKKAVVFLADGCEMVEALTPIDLLRRAGIEVLTVSINGREHIISSHNVEIKADRMFDEHVADHADMVILPGGMPGTLHLGEHKGVTDIVKRFHKEGKYISAICAAPSVLAAQGILEGKKAIAYPSFEEKLTGAEVVREEVVRDGNVITSRGMGTAIPFALALIEALMGQECAEKVKQDIIYKDGE